MEIMVEPSFEVLGIPVYVEEDENIDVDIVQDRMDSHIKDSVYRTLQSGCPIESIFIDRNGLIRHKIFPLHSGQ